MCGSHGVVVVFSDETSKNIGHIGKIEENIGKYSAK